MCVAVCVAVLEEELECLRVPPTASAPARVAECLCSVAVCVAVPATARVPPLLQRLRVRQLVLVKPTPL